VLPPPVGLPPPEGEELPPELAPPPPQPAVNAAITRAAKISEPHFFVLSIQYSEPYF